MRRILADMRVTSAGALHLVFALTGLEDRLDAGTADGTDVLYHRFLVNAAQYLISQQATAVVRSGIEVLGGNGTIEDFSVLPRLYRDAIVYESWEGTHNVLAAQVLNDLRRLPIVDAVEENLLFSLDHADSDGSSPALRERLARAINDARRCGQDAEFASWYFRSVLDELGVLAEAVYLRAGGRSDEATHLLAIYPDSAAVREPESVLARRIEAVLDAR
jgi:hypothetical protein